MLRKPEGREARGSAVFPCRLAGDKCPRHYSLMHINLGLAFPTHLCSMFHRLRKQLVSSHELVPRASVYSKCLGRLQRDGGMAGQASGVAWQLRAGHLTLRTLGGGEDLTLGVTRIVVGLETQGTSAAMRRQWLLPKAARSTCPGTRP